MSYVLTTHELLRYEIEVNGSTVRRVNLYCRERAYLTRMTRHLTYANLPTIRRTQVYRLRQAGSKRREHICRIELLRAVTKQCHVEVVSIT